MLAGAAPARAAVPVLVVDGRGWGHGVGMAQDGALWMGRAGASTAEILGHFYPGVERSRATGEVRVAVLDDDDRDVTVTFPGGGEVRSPRHGQQEAGFPITVEPGGAVRIRHDGRYRVVPAGRMQARSAGSRQLVPIPPPPGSSTTTTLMPAPAPSPTTTAPPEDEPTPPPATERTSGSSIWAIPARDATVGLPERAARYRGVVEAVAGDAGLRLVNQLDVEQYLRGMGEVRDPSWPQSSLRAQAIAARTYGLRAMAAAGEICDSQRCQVYLGQQAEYAAMDRAVRDTAGQVLRYRGGFAAAVYSANGGGVSATPREGFGTPDAAHPYLRAAPYETRTPDPWQVRIALTDLATRLDYPGELTDLRVAETGPSDRAVIVALEGSAGPRTIPAIQLQRAIGLRSSKWQTRIELGEAPPPPPEADRVQALPEHAALGFSAPTSAPTTSPVRADTAGDEVQTAGRESTGRPRWPLGALAMLAAAALGAAATRRAHRGAPSEKASG